MLLRANVSTRKKRKTAWERLEKSEDQSHVSAGSKNMSSPDIFTVRIIKEHLQSLNTTHLKQSTLLSPEEINL